MAVCSATSVESCLCLKAPRVWQKDRLLLAMLWGNLNEYLPSADRQRAKVGSNGNDQHAACNRPCTAADAGAVVVLQVRAQRHCAKQQQQATCKIDNIRDKRSDCRCQAVRPSDH